ncbi:MAG: HEPN domain-containing protein [Lachnospiraceae bacterium]|nr:HEPN domain-containing protein [Lachnospiraceae bacterium]
MTQEFYGKDLARYKLERAREELDTAELLFENERLKAANNRAYYSTYYSLTAVLCLEPIAFKKHKDTIGYFNKNYVHTDRFPREIGRNISKAAKIRHASDYDEFYIANKEEAERQNRTAKELVALVDKFISEK